ncbi:hypothetical protein NLJ89_g9049 [Agrocybe chaxingu]|uniref:Uncharacterized protein n=1 Tax=Agrocybe chaxingu TaxID=84603 RepID=A0A9W8JU47_9AGAR|nr:hypothetical protein NLJ89_g9049 [Agrocybe chaxingu]
MFSAVFDYDGTTEDHKAAFNTKCTELLEAVNALSHHQSANEDTSNWLLPLSPFYRGYLMRPGCAVDFKSDWVARSIIKNRALRKRPRYASKLITFDVFRKQRKWPDGSSSRSQLAHRYIANTSEVEPWPVKREIFKFQSIVKLFGNLENNMYYIPGDPAFPLFDAFTVDLDHLNKSAVLWVLQIPKSRLPGPGGSSLGYKKVRKIIASFKDQPTLRGPAASEDREGSPWAVHYLLVVPKGDSQKLFWGFPKGWSEN